MFLEAESPCRSVPAQRNFKEDGTEMIRLLILPAIVLPLAAASLPVADLRKVFERRPRKGSVLRVHQSLSIWLATGKPRAGCLHLARL